MTDQTMTPEQALTRAQTLVGKLRGKHVAGSLSLDEQMELGLCWQTLRAALSRPAVPELYEALAELVEQCGHPNISGWVNLERAIAALAKATGKPASPWVPVSERLPEPHTVVVLMNEARFMNVPEDMDFRWHGVGYLDDFGVKYWSVIGERAMTLEAATHWMPLPAPPAQGDQ